MTDTKADHQPPHNDVSQATVFRGEQTVLRAPTENSASLSGGSQPQAPLPEAGQFKVLKSRFVLEQRVGSGGMGSVFKAKDLRKVEARDSQPYLAVKVLNNDFKKHPEAFIALEREASKSQTLRHKNIVSIFDFDKDGDTPFITMELLEGQELAELLQAYPAGLPDELAWPIIQGLVEGLQHAHHQGVVHADFKPGNIYITSNNEARILDFGIARAMRLNHGAEDTDFDPAKLAALTPAYASREMLQGDNPEPRDDLYSLGVVIYMILTGTHPYGRVPANDAAREQLQVERIKGLTRNQWRTLSKCMSFNRKERPESADQVFEGLFVKASWKNISAATAAAVVLLSAGLFTSAYLQRADIDTVKEEVRTETLMYAQVQRISDLLATPRFDDEWNQTLFSEMQTLRTVAPGDTAYSAMLAQVNHAFADEIKQRPNLDEAFNLYRSGVQYDFTAQAKPDLEQRLLLSLDLWSTRPLNDEWLKQVESQLSYQSTYFSTSSLLTAARHDVLEHLALEIQRVANATDGDLVRVAEQAWNTFAADMFDAQTYEATAAALNRAVQAADSQQQHRQLLALGRQVNQRMDNTLNVSCLRLDLDLVGAELAALKSDHQRHAADLVASVEQRAIAKISDCVKRLGALDPDRALSFQKQALARFGEVEQLKNTGVDPCSMQYLVGNGRTPGPGGSCTDVVKSVDHPGKGPRLVVLAQGAQRYAISKYEISWQDLLAFCAGQPLCESLNWPEAGHYSKPATGLGVDLIEAYAAWLSQQTGYTYRLPTHAEWLTAASGTQDPNRNCRIATAGLNRGTQTLAIDAGKSNPSGLVHVLGNVQEIVRGEAGYAAVGGAYKDPIEQCEPELMRQANVNGDEYTGFRLVREVS